MNSIMVILAVLPWLWVSAFLAGAFILLAAVVQKKRFSLPISDNAFLGNKQLFFRAHIFEIVQEALIFFLVTVFAITMSHTAFVKESVFVEEEERADVLFVVDVSISMDSQKKFQMIGSTIKKILDENPSSSAGLVLFSEAAHELVAPTRNRDLFQKAFLGHIFAQNVQEAPWMFVGSKGGFGGTSIVAGIAKATEVFSRYEERKRGVLILLSDLEDSDSERTLRLLSLLPRSGIDIVVLGIEAKQKDLQRFIEVHPVDLRDMNDIESVSISLKSKIPHVERFIQDLGKEPNFLVLGAAILTLAVFGSFETFLRRLQWR